jgi:hypothetical protein
MRKRNERRWSRTRKRSIIQRMRLSRKRRTSNRTGRIGNMIKRCRRKRRIRRRR